MKKHVNVRDKVFSKDFGKCEITQIIRSFIFFPKLFFKATFSKIAQDYA